LRSDKALEVEANSSFDTTTKPEDWHCSSYKKKKTMAKIQKHDYLMKVENNEDGWKTIKKIRANAKECGSSYRLVLRGSKPKTPWGNRPSIPLDEAQEIRIYIRPKESVQYENPRAYDGVYDGLVHRNRALMDANQQLEDKNYKLRTQLEVLISNETSDKESEVDDLARDIKQIRSDMTDTLSYLLTKWGT
jgi:hypothetical protein